MSIAKRKRKKNPKKNKQKEAPRRPIVNRLPYLESHPRAFKP